MIRISRTLLIGLLLFTCAGFAESSTLTSDKVKKLVQQYDSLEAAKVIQEFNISVQTARPPHRPWPPQCDPDYGDGATGSCVKSVCDHLSSFDCNTPDRITDITRMCRNVRGSCVSDICSRVSRFECDDKYDMERVTQICQGLYSTSCIDHVCSRLSSFDCDEISELSRIADQCR